MMLLCRFTIRLEVCVPEAAAGAGPSPWYEDRGQQDPLRWVVTLRTASFRAQRDPELVHKRRSGVAAPVPRRPAGRDRAIPRKGAR